MAKRKFNCDYCNTSFDRYPGNVKNGKNKFCSKKCRLDFINKYKRVKFKCDYCHKESIKGRWEYNLAKKKHFCDMNCAKLYRGNIDPISHPKLKGKFVDCSVCGESVYKYPTFLKKNKTIFCSNKCYGRSMVERMIFNCETCGKIVERNKSKYSQFKSHFCSLKCYYEPMKKIQKQIPRACGCGSMINKYDKKGREVKFLIGHMFKTKPMHEELKKYTQEIISLYSRGYVPKHIFKILNTKYGLKYKSEMGVCTILKENNINMRKPAVYGTKQKTFETDDGHNVMSSAELLIDNWLFVNRILHQYNKPIADTKYRYDFYIPEANLYIEYWGAWDNEKYKEKALKKLKVYSDLGLNLLQIFPQDNIQDKLKVLLQYSKTQKQIGDFE